MLFTITKAEESGGRTIVTGKTTAGILKGIWKSKTAPVIGKSCQTELTLKETVRKEITVLKVPAESSIKLTGDTVTFICRVEDKDDIYYLRFSGDGLEMLDITDDDGTIETGDMISFSLQYDEIGIYPYTT